MGYLITTATEAGMLSASFLIAFVIVRIIERIGL